MGDEKSDRKREPNTALITYCRFGFYFLNLKLTVKPSPNLGMVWFALIYRPIFGALDWSGSSVGRAQDWKSWCREFNSPPDHNIVYGCRISAYRLIWFLIPSKSQQISLGRCTEIPYFFACSHRSAMKELVWFGSSVWLERRPVTAEVASSSLVRTAHNSRNLFVENGLRLFYYS